MPGCLVKRCLSFLILGVNKLPVGQQQLDHTKLAAPGAELEVILSKFFFINHRPT